MQEETVQFLLIQSLFIFDLKNYAQRLFLILLFEVFISVFSI